MACGRLVNSLDVCVYIIYIISYINDKQYKKHKLNYNMSHKLRDSNGGDSK